jgi:hypothetical protein
LEGRKERKERRGAEFIFTIALHSQTSGLVSGDVASPEREPHDKKAKVCHPLFSSVWR